MRTFESILRKLTAVPATSPRLLLGLALCGLLAGCASQSARVAKGLDTEHSDFHSNSCKGALASVDTHETIKTSRLIAGPTLVLLSGGLLAIPVIATNAALDTYDQLDAAKIKTACTGQQTSDLEIAGNVAQNGALSLVAKGLELPTLGGSNPAAK
ncbi:MAG: hypothetical protein RL483_1209 [Pseudomonadota bacterium]|jgi:hypothetical protein